MLFNSYENARKRTWTLFVDVKRSTQYLMKFNKEFMFNELDDSASPGGDRCDKKQLKDN